MNWGYMKNVGYSTQEESEAWITAPKPKLDTAIAAYIKTNCIQADTKETPKYKRRRTRSNYDWDSDTHHWANGKHAGGVL